MVECSRNLYSHRARTGANGSTLCSPPTQLHSLFLHCALLFLAFMPLMTQCTAAVDDWPVWMTHLRGKAMPIECTRFSSSATEFFTQTSISTFCTPRDFVPPYLVMATVGERVAAYTEPCFQSPEFKAPKSSPLLTSDLIPIFSFVQIANKCLKLRTLFSVHISLL